MTTLMSVEDKFNLKGIQYKKRIIILGKVMELYVPNNTQVYIQAKLQKF